MMRKVLLLAGSFAALAAAASLPASPVTTPITFTLDVGALSMSAPAASVPLGSSQWPRPARTRSAGSSARSPSPTTAAAHTLGLRL